MTKKEEEWKAEKKELETKIATLEDIFEQMDKEKRKKNIIMSGLQGEGESTKTEVEKIIKEKMGLEPKIKEAYLIGKGGQKKRAVVKLSEWKDKMEILKNKTKLKGSRIDIDSDLTLREMKIQATIREGARKVRNNENFVKVGYKKLIVNRDSYVWNNQENCLQLVKEKN